MCDCINKHKAILGNAKTVAKALSSLLKSDVRIYSVTNEKYGVIYECEPVSCGEHLDSEILIMEFETKN